MLCCRFTMSTKFETMNVQPLSSLTPRLGTSYRVSRPRMSDLAPRESQLFRGFGIRVFFFCRRSHMLEMDQLEVKSYVGSFERQGTELNASRVLH